MAKRDTIAEVFKPMLGKPSIKRECCAICGRNRPLNQHHIVRRGAGKAYDEHGRELKKPTVTLCGIGNNLHDADGNELCHGLAHHNRLHFRWVQSSKVACAGHWEYIVCDEPTDYLTALSMDGWRRL